VSILLEAEYHLDIGDRIICQFTLPGSSQIENEGDVVRSVKKQAGVHQYGVQFIALPLSSRREIDKSVASVKSADAALMK
jgi:PilZ domain